LVRVLA
jgi:hypothetical protein